MIVREIVVRTARLPMSGGLRNARRAWSAKDICLAFAVGDDGRMGVGEGWTSYGSPEALAATIRDDVAPIALGRPVWETQRLVEACRRAVEMSARGGVMAAACAAVEMAMWDLWGRTLGVPLARLFGQCRGSIPVYAGAGLYAPGKTAEDLAAELRGYVAQGFTTVKLKVGVAPLEEDVARVAAVRATVGLGIGVLVDAHYTMGVAEAVAFAHAVRDLGVGWLEAPIRPDDVEGYRLLRRKAAIPICGCETLQAVRDFSALIDARGVDVVMFDISTCGGFIESRRITDRAHAANPPVTLHASSSVMLTLANLHFAASVPNLQPIELHMLHRWLNDRTPEGALSVVDGRVAVPERPGLGLCLTPDDPIFDAHSDHEA